MIRNFVAKNNFNRSAVHKSAKDYSRQKLNARDYNLYDLYDIWDEDELPMIWDIDDIYIDAGVETMEPPLAF